MRPLNTITGEFIRCYRLLIERTGDDPTRVATVLDEFSDVAGCTAALQKIDQEIQSDRYSRHPIAHAHQDFRRALHDYRNRWASAVGDARPQIYRRAARRIAEESVRCYRLLVERTANNPSAVADLGARRPELAYPFGVLD